MKNDNEVLERNVSTLIETGGEPPRITDVARARIKAALVDKYGVDVKPRLRSPASAIAVGLAAAAVVALIVTRLVGDDAAPTGNNGTLADGSTWIVEPGAKVDVIGPRRVRVHGAALLDVVPGKGTFVVETARGTVEVLGTRFLVDAEADRTTAAVVRGSVKLASSDGNVTLHAGELGVAEAGRPPSRGPAPRLTSLVSWAKLARRRAEHDVVPLRNGTLFAREPNNPHVPESPLPIVKLGVDVVVEDQVARVAIDQTFHNPKQIQLEGMYRFAIPPDASLQRLAMYVNGELQEAAVVERMRARRIYEEIVYRRMDPALLEWAGTGRLALRVYPLPPQEDKRLLLAYTQSLPKLYDDWTLSVPLPEVDLPVGELGFSVKMRGCANCEITSTSHKISVERAGDDAVVSYSGKNEKLGDSLVLHVRDGRKQSVIGKHGEYMLVRARPELGNTPRAYRPRTWVIVDDVSASRGPMELRAQQDLIDGFLRELDEQDKVAIVAFDVEARVKLAPTKVIDVDRAAVRRALEDEGGVGATSFAAALTAATKLLAGTQADDAMLVYVGDGVITTGAKNLDALRAQIAGKLKFIGVGVGDGPDTQTLEALAAATGGYATTIDLADDVGWRAFDLVAALHTPRVVGLDAKLVDAAGTLVPSTTYLKTPQLADGEELELVAKLAGSGTPAFAVVTGTLDGKPWEQRIALDHASESAGYLPRLWAQRHIAARLLAKHEPVAMTVCTKNCPTEGEVREHRDEAIRKEVVALGKQYFLLSRHTSLIVLENDKMYAQYNVTKGSGDTWAPYKVPAKIPVVKTASVVVPSDVAHDAELVRSPMPVFYAYDQWALEQRVTINGRFQQNPLADEDAFTRRTESPGIAVSRGHLGLREPNQPFGGVAAATETKGEAEKGPMPVGKSSTLQTIDLVTGSDAPAEGDFKERKRISTDEMLRDQQVAHGWFGNGQGRGSRWGGSFGYGGLLAPQRFTYTSDTAFDDLTAFVPALFPDASDTLRTQLEGAKQGTLDASAKALLDQARRAMPVGVVRWGKLEIALDGAHRIAWHRTTDSDLAETATFDGTSFTRRYPELGLDVTRPIAEDDVALAFAYLPLWIAEPAHYARWFDVKLARPRTVSLSRDGKLVYELEFDDKHHLVAIRDAKNTTLVAITWGAQGPIGARVGGDDLDVGFTPQAIDSAIAWAGGTAGITVELPSRMPAYWTDRIAKLTAGTPEWRHAQRQLMVSHAAMNNRPELFKAYEALRTNGGVQLGDLALASGGIATGSTDAQFATALAPLGSTPIARYLIGSRAHGKAPSQPDRMKAETQTGLVGALWTLRETVALLQAGKDTRAIDKLMSLGERAFDLRLIGTAIATQRYTMKPADIARAWDAVAVGEYRNVARAQAAQAIGNRGAYDLAAERVAALVADLDLRAAPPQLGQLQWQFQNSRRGQAGWQLVWATWRDRVLASDSFEHVMALMQLAGNHAIDIRRSSAAPRRSRRATRSARCRSRSSRPRTTSRASRSRSSSRSSRRRRRASCSRWSATWRSARAASPTRSHTSSKRSRRARTRPWISAPCARSSRRSSRSRVSSPCSRRVRRARPPCRRR
jgi:hypothetical protein